MFPFFFVLSKKEEWRLLGEREEEQLDVTDRLNRGWEHRKKKKDEEKEETDMDEGDRAAKVNEEARRRKPHAYLTFVQNGHGTVTGEGSRNRKPKKLDEKKIMGRGKGGKREELLSLL